MTDVAVLLISMCIIVIMWTITDSEGIMGMLWREDVWQVESKENNEWVVTEYDGQKKVSIMTNCMRKAYKGQTLI